LSNNNIKKTDNSKPNVFIGFLKFISTIIILCLVLVPLGMGILLIFNSPVYSIENEDILHEIGGITIGEDGGYYFEVRKGETSQSVGNRLERAGFIRNRYFWNLICRLENDHIKTGRYKIELPMNQIGILRLLRTGNEILFRVTIPEGVTLRKTAAILEENGFCSAKDFLAAASDPNILKRYNVPNQTMEGYLFPDTYLFPKDFSAYRIAEIMADNFFSKLESISPSLLEMDPEELNKIVILASIVEREYRLEEEAHLIAGVFSNRLRINMLLQSCATIQYIITEIQGLPHPAIIFYRDLEIRNPYNTYMFRGLPPGPISAPGIVSLRAAVYPESTNFLYFRLTDPARGRHYFSRTYDEHIRAGQLFTKPASQ
jgi:UPF0755 protein